MRRMNSTEDASIRYAGIACAIIVLFSVASFAMPVPGNTENSTHIISIPKATTGSGLTDIPSLVGTPTRYDILAQIHLSPKLASPTSGETIFGNKPTQFSWELDGVLQENEWSELRIRRPGKPYRIIGITHERCFYLDVPTDGFGSYEWQVVIVRLDASGNKLILCRSPWQQFTWTTEPPTPTPDAVVIIESGLRLRYGPGVSYDPPIGYLRNGETLEIQGRDVNNGWILITSIDSPDKFGWTSARSRYVKLNIPLYEFPIVALSPPPTLLKPPDKTNVAIPNRLGLEWTSSESLGPSDYFRVEIWNGYNNFVEPIDVAWIKATNYDYEQVKLAYHPVYRWRVTVIRGTPAGEKDWSTPENRVWEPSNRFTLVSEESETWTLTIEPPDSTDPLPPTTSPPDDDDDDDGGGGGSVPGG